MWLIGQRGRHIRAAAASPAAANPTAASTALTVRHTSLGAIITNNRGFTLYAFEADKGTKSACSGACASAWPPVTTTSGSSIKVTGAAKSLVGVAKQANGILQVTYAGHLLYRFQGDGSPGSTNGQGSTALGAGGRAYPDRHGSKGCLTRCAPPRSQAAARPRCWPAPPCSPATATVSTLTCTSAT